MAVTGDFMMLAQLRQRLARMGTGEVLRVLGSRLATETQEQMLRGFREQRDPYGRKWAPRKPPPAWAVRAFGLVDDHHPILDKTGQMIDGGRSRFDGRRILVTLKSPAPFHQSGTIKMVRRQMLPTADMGGLGPIWTAGYVKVSGEVLKKFIGR